MFVVSGFLKHFNPSEKKLRAMYRIGYAAGLEQARKQSAPLPLATPVQTVVALPTQQAQQPVKRTLVPVKPGMLWRAYRITHKKPETTWHPPTRPAMHFTAVDKQAIYTSVPTVMDIGAALEQGRR